MIVEVDGQVLFERYCLVDAALDLGGRFETWILPPAPSTEAQSKTWRGDRATASSTSRDLPLRRRMRLIETAYRQSNRATAIPATICLPGDAASSRVRLVFAGFGVGPSRNGQTGFPRLRRGDRGDVRDHSCDDIDRPCQDRPGPGSALPYSAVLGVISAIDAAVSLVNGGVTLVVRPVPLPGLELRNGVPESLRTLVAVPTLLTTPEDIAEQVERLEIHHLASPEGDLHFALLSDWIDADGDRAEGDAELVAFARDGIERLNRRYGLAPRARAFSCCTVGGSGTKAKGAGLAGSGSEANFMN